MQYFRKYSIHYPIIFTKCSCQNHPHEFSKTYCMHIKKHILALIDTEMLQKNPILDITIFSKNRNYVLIIANITEPNVATHIIRQGDDYKTWGFWFISPMIMPARCRSALTQFTTSVLFRTDSRLAPSQWETSLQSIAVSHWLGANLESALLFYRQANSMTPQSPFRSRIRMAFPKQCRELNGRQNQGTVPVASMLYI